LVSKAEKITISLIVVGSVIQILLMYFLFYQSGNIIIFGLPAVVLLIFIYAFLTLIGGIVPYLSYKKYEKRG